MAIATAQFFVSKNKNVKKVRKYLENSDLVRIFAVIFEGYVVPIYFIG